MVKNGSIPFQLISNPVKPVRPCSVALGVVVCLAAFASPRAAGQTREEVAASLTKAVAYFHGKASRHGGYVYRMSRDGGLREAEGIPGPDTIWIQPPGTPAVGDACLDAWLATGDEACLKAAREAGQALVLTQLHSGGWDYSGNLDPAARDGASYRRALDGTLLPDPTPEAERTAKGGWTVWKTRRYQGNLSTLDDNVTQAALAFLIRLDVYQKQRDARVHDAVAHGLEALLGIQAPNGGWATSWDRFPLPGGPPDVAAYPVKKASWPAEWPRTWPKDFTGCHVTNDHLHANVVKTLLLAWKGYREPRYLEAVRKAGDFLLDAQLPEPQPGWAQQYDAAMQPVWGRAFECTAITSHESQGILRALIDIHRATDDARYLEPVPPALAYFRRSLLPDGKLSRFYEPATNKPVYFTRGPGGKGHVLTYEDDRLASNYGFIRDSELDDIERAFRAAKAKSPAPSLLPTGAALREKVREALAAQESDGAWPTKDGLMRDAEGKKVQPAGGVIESQVFIDRAQILAAYLKETAAPRAGP